MGKNFYSYQKIINSKGIYSKYLMNHGITSVAVSSARRRWRGDSRISCFLSQENEIIPTGSRDHFLDLSGQALGAAWNSRYNSLLLLIFLFVFASGARKGVLRWGCWAASGLVILVFFVFHLQPGKPPVDVMLVIIAW